MFRAGLYARVSTTDQQTVPVQVRALREHALRRGWTIALQVKEVGSGASERQLREKLLEAARRRHPRRYQQCLGGGAGRPHLRGRGGVRDGLPRVDLHADRKLLPRHRISDRDAERSVWPCRGPQVRGKTRLNQLSIRAMRSGETWKAPSSCHCDGLGMSFWVRGQALASQLYSNLGHKCSARNYRSCQERRLDTAALPVVTARQAV